MEIRMLTVGPVAENCYVIRQDGATEALVIDPGEEADRIMEPVRELGLEVVAILLTHCHFDHVGAVAPIARETGAPVYCPQLETGILADIESYTWPGLGPYESYEADRTVAGGERFELAGFEIDVRFTPGHSPGHVTYAIPEHDVLLSGDVLFRGSVGRVDLPGGDWATLQESIRGLVEEYPASAAVHPGHGPTTNLEVELAGNPFLADIESAGAGRERGA